MVHAVNEELNHHDTCRVQSWYLRFSPNTQIQPHRKDHFLFSMISFGCVRKISWALFIILVKLFNLLKTLNHQLCIRVSRYPMQWLTMIFYVLIYDNCAVGVVVRVPS